MTRSILPALGLLAFVSSSLADTVLLPRLNTVKPLQSRSVIAGLLQRATSTCGTCPSGGACCSDGNCCSTAGTLCCSDGGCCDIGWACVTVDGEKGCCPIGETCTSSGGPTMTAKTTGTTTKATATGTTKTTTTATGGATRTQSAVTSTPTASAGFKIVVVDMSSSALTFDGSWASTSISSCSDGTSKSVSSDTESFSSAGVSTVSYQFTGTAIYVKSASNNAHYMIQLDDDVTEYGGASSSSDTDAPTNCTYGWWRAGLESTAHSLAITVYGANQTTDSSVSSQDMWGLELQNFVVMQMTSSGSGNGSGSGSGSGSGAGTTTASFGRLAVVLFMAGFWMV